MYLVKINGRNLKKNLNYYIHKNRENNYFYKIIFLYDLNF